MSPDAPTTTPFASVALLGLGVMGGSLGQALGALRRPPRRVGWSPDPGEGEAALAGGALDAVAGSVEDAVAGAEVVVLAVPVAACVELLPRVLRAMPPDAVLTDVASLKGPVWVAVSKAGARARWVGSHPMCGSADSGYRASRPDLYRGARVWVVLPPEAGEHVDAVDALWLAVGAHTVRIDSSAHDALMSFVSHLPQLASNALARTLEDAGVAAAALGPGGIDMTRLAGSSPEMWRDILALSFTPPLSDGLRTMADHLRALADALEARDVDAIASLMEATRAWKTRT
ncbi:MAG: hypothetical protein AMXMBFR53_35110 [Gemmatimonadota bacterium]